jgi:biopolymer transport protein ExbB/TolQ
MNGIIQFVQENFMHVAPILAAGAIGLIIIFERAIAVMAAYPLKNPRAFFDKIRNYILNERVGEAIALCEHYRGKPVAHVVREALLRAHQPESVITHGLEVAVGEEQERIQARISFLAMIANVATLLGLLGTILGLIQSFEAVGSASAQQRSALLAAGISTAMNATMFGLAVAIPCMVAFSFLTNRANRLSAEVERSAVRVMELIKQRYYANGEGNDPHHHGGNHGRPQVKMARPA